MRSELRESETERGGKIKVRRGGEVYELLNARLTTGGSSTVDPIKCKQKKKKIEGLFNCSVTSHLTMLLAVTRAHERTTAQQIAAAVRLLFVLQLV